MSWRKQKLKVVVERARVAIGDNQGRRVDSGRHRYGECSYMDSEEGGRVRVRVQHEQELLLLLCCGDC